MSFSRGTRPAGGAGHVETINEKRANILYNDSPRKNVLPLHLRSAFHGAGFTGNLGERFYVPPSSPRYMQATASSRAGSRPGSAAAPSSPAMRPSPSLPPDTRDFQTMADYGNEQAFEVDISDLGPAGAGPNDAMKSLIDFGGQGLGPEDEPRRPFRREITIPGRQVPATTGGIASPTRGATLESPRAAADQRLREAGMFMEAGNEPVVQQQPSAAAVQQPLSTTRRPPRAPTGGGGGGGGHNNPAYHYADAQQSLRSPYHSSHDKSLPNSRRSVRGSGMYPQTGPAQHSIAHEANPDAEPAFLTDAGFSSAAMHRRGRGRANPAAHPPKQPISNPNEAGVPVSAPAVTSVVSKETGFHGLASGASKTEQQLLGGRRARGLCSPRASSGTNFMMWGDPSSAS